MLLIFFKKLFFYEFLNENIDFKKQTVLGLKILKTNKQTNKLVKVLDLKKNILDNYIHNSVKFLSIYLISKFEFST